MRPRHVLRLRLGISPLPPLLLMAAGCLLAGAPVHAQWYSPECRPPGQELMDPGPEQPQAEFQIARLMYTDASGRMRGGWATVWLKEV